MSVITVIKTVATNPTVVAFVKKVGVIVTTALAHAVIKHHTDKHASGKGVVYEGEKRIIESNPDKG